MKNIEIIRSRRKTLAIEIGRDLSVTVRAPLWVSQKAIESFLAEKADWIAQKTAQLKERIEAQANEPKFTLTELNGIKQKASARILPRVAHFAPIIGVDYARITLRFQRTLWGSCTSRGNLSFNALLVLCPDEVLDYVIIHELCHRKHPDHSKAFWAEVEKYMPTYRQAKAWLKENGRNLIEKIPRET